MTTSSIDIDRLKQQLSEGRHVALIDVRRTTDYATLPQLIPSASWRDPEKIENWINELDADNPTVVYCVKGGSVSQSVTDRLRREGLDALFLEGGLKAWTDDGQAVAIDQSRQHNYTLQQSDVDLLRNSGVPDEDIAHSVKVAEKALEIAARTNEELDFEFVGRGALFHDLGKAKTHDIEHGKIGAEMGEALGLPDAVNAVMEKHIRGGLTEEEAVELNLPVKDYTLHMLEERIIIYADRLVDIITEGVVPIAADKEAEDGFEEILRTYPKYGKNDITLARYLNYHREIQKLMQQ